jgi:glycerate dehydrogenase
LSWAPLAALGRLTVFERSTPRELLSRAAGAELLITNKAGIDRGAIESLPELRYIGVTATGTNVVDREAARARDVVVSNVPSYGADSVAEHTLSLMLEGVKHLSRHLGAVRAGGWARQPDFSFTVAPVSLLAGKTLGLVGLGAIGARVAELALAFRMNVLAARRDDNGTSSSRPDSSPLTTRVARVPLDELLERADIVSLHCPLARDNERFIDARRLAQMKPAALLINTSRGGLIDEAALADALCRGQIAGAYLDVLGVEPPPEAHPLVALPNCWITPHMAWASVEARRRLLEVSIANVCAFLAGHPVNVVT